MNSVLFIIVLIILICFIIYSNRVNTERDNNLIINKLKENKEKDNKYGVKKPSNKVIYSAIKEHLSNIEHKTKNSPESDPVSETKSFYAWFGREQNEHTSKDVNTHSTGIPPPYYILNNVNFADLKGELYFLYKEFFLKTDKRKYGINILDKWLITYNKDKISGGFISMQDNVIGPFSYTDTEEPNGGWICPGFVFNKKLDKGYSGDGKWFYPEEKGIYKPNDIVKSEPGWMPIYHPTHQSKCKVQLDGLVKTINDTDGLGRQPQPELYGGVWLSIIGDCPNLPQDSLNSEGSDLSELSGYKIPTKCNGKYSHGCNDTESSGFNQKCMRTSQSSSKIWESKLCLPGHDIGKNGCFYKTEYIGSIRLDDLGNINIGNNGNYNDTCSSYIHNILKKNGINYTNKVNSDIDTLFWKLGKNPKTNSSDYQKLLNMMNDNSFLCHQTDKTATYASGPNPNIKIPENIYEINSQKGTLEEI